MHLRAKPSPNVQIQHILTVQVDVQIWPRLTVQVDARYLGLWV
jgi:hypothetical protein